MISADAHLTLHRIQKQRRKKIQKNFTTNRERIKNTVKVSSTEKIFSTISNELNKKNCFQW